MRLIDVKTFELVEFIGNDIPPYSIFSHRWGKASDEVSFEIMSTSLSKAKKRHGFQKIEYCAKQAEYHGMNYCWVDTCCIDKRSSAELTEAINSMFSWYERATTCYAYLEDVIWSDGWVLGWKLTADSEWFSRG